MATKKGGVANNRSMSRAQLISTVQTPLGFFVLVTLVVEGIFGGIAAMSSGSDRTYLIVGMLVLIFALVLIVAILAVIRPESLRGQRPSESAGQSSFAQVLTISKPHVLCAASDDFENLGFDEDAAVVKRSFDNVQVEHNLTAGRLRMLLAQQRFDVVHLLTYVEEQSGAMIFRSGERLPSEGFAGLIEVTGARLVILASCDSVDLAAKTSRIASTIAATASIDAAAFVSWAECFYGLLARGQPLSVAYHVARTTTDLPMVLLLKNDVAFAQH